MVDSVSTNRVHVTHKPSPPFPVHDAVLIPGLLPIFLHGCEIKSGSGLGTRLEDHMMRTRYSQYSPDHMVCLAGLTTN